MNQLQTNVYVKPELEIEFTPQDVVDWVQWLYLNEKSESTIIGYKYALQVYVHNLGAVMSKGRMLMFKKYLTEKHKPKTINLRLVGVNSFISYLAEKHENPKIYNFKTKGSKIHTRTSVENVITTEEFNKLLDYCKTGDLRDGEKWYYIIKTLGYTGVRVSELVQLQVEDLIKYGYFKVHGKGDKYRDVLLPNDLKKELLAYANKYDITGYIFKPTISYKSNDSLTTRGVSHFIYTLAEPTGVPKEHCHPHSFRHMYALNLLEATNKDISFVSDMLGHSSLSTTSVYLKMSLDKQKNIINDKVKW